MEESSAIEKTIISYHLDAYGLETARGDGHILECHNMYVLIFVTDKQPLNQASRHLPPLEYEYI